MKINVASPSTGTRKTYELEDEKKLHRLYEKRIAQTFDGELISDAFKGYVLKITGGQDKQGFPMKQGVLTSSRVRLLLKKGDIGFQTWRGRKGERRRKSVRGCIVSSDIGILHCSIVKEGPEKVEGLNDHIIPRRLGPKRANKIRKLFNLTKQDDVRKFVIRRFKPKKVAKSGKTRRAFSKAPKIQRLVTPVKIQRWRKKRLMVRAQRQKSRTERREYYEMLAKRKEVSHRQKRAAVLRAMHVQRKKELKNLKVRRYKRQKRKENKKAGGSKKKVTEKKGKASAKQTKGEGKVAKAADAATKKAVKAEPKVAKKEVGAPAKKIADKKQAPATKTKPTAKGASKPAPKPKGKAPQAKKGGK